MVEVFQGRHVQSLNKKQKKSGFQTSDVIFQGLILASNPINLTGTIGITKSTRRSRNLQF